MNVSHTKCFSHYSLYDGSEHIFVCIGTIFIFYILNVICPFFSVGKWVFLNYPCHHFQPFIWAFNSKHCYFESASFELSCNFVGCLIFCNVDELPISFIESGLLLVITSSFLFNLCITCNFSTVLGVIDSWTMFILYDIEE